MSDGFDALIGDARRFFAELAANNRKDWFEPRKAHYIETIRKPAEWMADLVAENLARLTGVAQTPKVFRIHRDVRFSKDKSPYNPHLHILWRPSGSDIAPGWLFGVAPDYVTAGTGISGLSGANLARFRAMIDRDGDALATALETARDTVEADLTDWGPASLIRVPKPYDADHRHADLLKRKALTVMAPVPVEPDAPVLPALDRIFRTLMPVWRVLDAEFG